MDSYHQTGPTQVGLVYNWEGPLSEFQPGGIQHHWGELKHSWRKPFTFLYIATKVSTVPLFYSVITIYCPYIGLGESEESWATPCKGKSDFPEACLVPSIVNINYFIYSSYLVRNFFKDTKKKFNVVLKIFLMCISCWSFINASRYNLDCDYICTCSLCFD